MFQSSLHSALDIGAVAGVIEGSMISYVYNVHSAARRCSCSERNLNNADLRASGIVIQNCAIDLGCQKVLR